MQIRLARQKDISFIVRGRQESSLISFSDYKRTQRTKNIHYRAIKKALGDKKQIIFIAEYKNEPAGFLWAKVLTSKTRGTKDLRIHSIWISKVSRRQGVASKFLQKLFELAELKKIKIISAMVTATNSGMRRFIKTHNFHLQRLLFEKKLR